MVSVAGGAFTSDNTVIKARPIHKKWRAMFAGDIATAHSVLERMLIGAATAPDEDLWATQIKEICRDAYLAERVQHAEDLVLGTFGVKMADFLQRGEAMFGSVACQLLRDRLQQVSLDVECLVAGHDRNGAPHIFAVSNPTFESPSVIQDHTSIGYWAIGSGAYLALSSLAARNHSWRMHTHTALYNLCEAKFAAESAVGVGKETVAVVIHPDWQWTFVDESLLKYIRKEWTRVGRPRPATSARAKVLEWLQQAQKHPAGQPPSKPTSSSTDQT